MQIPIQKKGFKRAVFTVQLDSRVYLSAEPGSGGSGPSTGFTCSDEVKACRCESVTDCFNMSEECKERGYDASGCSDKGCICYAQPLTGGGVGRLIARQPARVLQV